MKADPDIEALLGEHDFDSDDLARRYAIERDKRLREDKNNQYIEVKADFSNFVDDPYVEPGFAREPLTDTVEVLVIGGGFGGVLCAARLREAGIESIRIVEKGGDLGGCWYWNRYPGIRCDTESYVYMPLLEELGYTPSDKYARGSEIREHIGRVARHYHLYDDVCLQTEVKALAWDEAASQWLISTDRGDKMRARFVMMANGPLDRPKLPAIPGIADFKGHTFHTSRWDYDYTGGTFAGNLSGLRDKRVGVIGTGATGVQCIPFIAESAEQLYVFQRTPAAVDRRNNRPTDEAWSRSLAQGWQAQRKDNFNHFVTGLIQGEDMVQDGWTEIGKLLDPTASWAGPILGRELTPEEGEYISTILDDKVMNRMRDWIDSCVDDPETAALLKPWHRRWCKRPLFHDEYYTTFNRPNVTLVDTDGQGVERITANAVVVDGKEYELDCLIFATGFEVGTEYKRRAGYDVVGRGGVTLSQQWANGMRTFNGLQMREFPNCFYIGFGQNANATNFCFILDEQAQHAAYIVNETIKRNAMTVEPTEEAIEAYIEEVSPLSISQLKFWVECTPSYMNGEGESEDPNGFFANLHPAGTVGFYNKLRDWRKAGTLEGLELAQESTRATG
ncbi:MAG: NAD(P)/FAD-dependent oxidoreductase [Pseudomonadota bacterium]